MDFIQQLGNTHTKPGIEALLSALNQTALVSVTDARGDILYVNQKFIDVSRYTADELVGQNHRILKSGHQPDSVFKDLWRTISGGKVWRGELKNRAKDGTYYWVDTSIAPIPGPDGTPDRYISVRFLITDKKHREQLLEEAKAKDEALLTSIGDGVIATDKYGTVLFINPKAEELLGWKEHQAIGRPLTDVLRIEDESGNEVPYEQRPIQQALTLRKTVTAYPSYYYIRPDGTKMPAAITVAPIILKDEIIGAIDVFRDVTREKEVDTAKTEFVSLASHQLRTPATAVKQYIGLILEGHAGEISDPTAKRFLQAAYDSNERQLRVVSDLLNVAKADAGKIHLNIGDCRLANIARSVVDGQKDALAEKNQTAAVICKKPEARVLADKDYLFTVIENLVENAIKYSPAHTAITVTVGSTARCASVEVKDEGIGISSDDQAKLFKKFSRINSPASIGTEGSGLGLYWVKRIINLHGGDISVSSAAGKGTAFTIKLPVAPTRIRRPTTKSRA